MFLMKFARGVEYHSGTANGNRGTKSSTVICQRAASIDQPGSLPESKEREKNFDDLQNARSTEMARKTM